MTHSSRVIAISAQKGGVGKTATTINLGVALAQKGMRVLLIDCDNHPSLSIRLGIQWPDDLEMSLPAVLQKIMLGVPLETGEGILHHKEGIDFLPSSTRLADVEASLAGEIGREMVLKTYIDSIRGQYDYILLDCLPSLGLIAINALTAADEVMPITKADFDSAKGMEDLLVTIEKIKRKINSRLKVMGALITMVDLRTNDAKETIDMLLAAYGESIRFFKTMIPASVRAREAGKYGISIHRHAPTSSVALAYTALAQEVEQYE